MTRSRAAGLAVALMLAACGGSEDDGDGGPRPPERLAAAITSLAEADTGHFASRTTGSGGVRHSTIEGAYQLTPPAASVTVSRYDESGLRATEVLAVGRDAWSRDVAPDPADAPCWVHYDVTELFANGLLVRNGDTYFPAPLAVAAYGTGVYSIAADQVSGTTELTSLLSVTDLSLPAKLGLSRADDHRVPAVFQLDSDGLAGWKVAMRDAVETMRELAESSPGGDGGINALSVLGGSISTEVTERGEAVDIVPPPADETVDYVTDPKELARLLAEC